MTTSDLRRLCNFRRITPPFSDVSLSPFLTKTPTHVTLCILLSNQKNSYNSTPLYTMEAYSSQNLDEIGDFVLISSGDDGDVRQRAEERRSATSDGDGDGGSKRVLQNLAVKLVDLKVAQNLIYVFWVLHFGDVVQPWFGKAVG
ncbi:hypothetical protein L1987_87647 [Smallanthus sonchifolius]|nr:hypothetical protein L1987_87647 [Smallanthus sonchifolius]